MREVIQHEPGTFCWPELATTDTDAAGHFYASLFGWAIKKQETGPQAYTELWKGPRPAGGRASEQERGGAQTAAWPTAEARKRRPRTWARRVRRRHRTGAMTSRRRRYAPPRGRAPCAQRSRIAGAPILSLR